MSDATQTWLVLTVALLCAKEANATSLGEEAFLVLAFSWVLFGLWRAVSLLGGNR